MIAVEETPGIPTQGSENEWTLTQTVLEVAKDRCKVEWRRTDTTLLDGASPTTQRGELWIDELGRTELPEGGWSPALFPEERLEVGATWSQESPHLGMALHFQLEAADEISASLVCFAQTTEETFGTQEIRGATKLCRQTGRVLSSTTVTKILRLDGRTSQTVVEVNSLSDS